MESISIFDIFKIGVGPSSSHTLGPWNAALVFIENLNIQEVDRIQIRLYGSLSKTGKGHATDKAIVLGLSGYDPKEINTNDIDVIISDIVGSQQLDIKSRKISFDFDKDIIFDQLEHSLHPNTLKFEAFSNGACIKEELFASVGGGFLERDERKDRTSQKNLLPYPIVKARDLLNFTMEHSCSISDIVLQNELSIRSEEEINAQIDLLLDVILDSIYHGCSTRGILPGGLNVSRRAYKICNKLIGGASYSSREELVEIIKAVPKTFNSINKWISCFALAVNEQNASMGRVVTSPTNGAAGVIPAVLMYYVLFCDYGGKDEMRRFLFTAGEVGCLIKKGATISAAVGGCQAEIGASSAMAAAALTEVLGGSPEQCLIAAEIAIEHHLGLTCDPIGGLVQVPCIERNAMGANKAITAANLALDSNFGDTVVSLDAAIKTMKDVAKDMHSKYKETSEGGLALNLPVVNPNC